ncbi:MAG: trigger factor [Clostridia bacterium]|nr:trigger factor [Clostridia bacterium]
MDVKLEKLENSEVKLEITVESKRFDEAMEKAYKKNAKYFKVPGFRDGKAPMQFAIKHYGEGVLYEEAFNILVPEVLLEVYKEKELDVVAQPSIDLVQIGMGKDFIFTANVTVKPEFKLGKYKGLKLEKKEYPVTDDQINEELKRKQSQNSRMVEAKPGSELKVGDTGIIDFEGFVDGVPFEGGKAEGHSLEIGSGQFIPGFEDQLVGMKSEEERDINVKFPDEYFSKDLAGKDAVFKVKLHEIKVKELPELDDEFAKDVSEFDTLDELKADIKEHLEDQNAQKAKDELNQAAIDAVVENTELNIPKAMLDQEVEAYVEDMEHNLSRQGLSLEQYLGFMGKDINQFKDEYRVNAEKNIKTRLILEEISKTEELEVKDEDVDERIKELAKQYGRDADEFLKNAGEQTRNYVREELKYDVAVKFIIANAK